MRRFWRWYFGLPTWAYFAVGLVCAVVGYLSAIALEAWL